MAVNTFVAGDPLTAAQLNTYMAQWLTAGGALQSYTPTFAGAGLTVGNGTVSGSWCQIGKLVHFRARFILGTTSAVNGVVTCTLPATAVSSIPLGSWHVTFLDFSASKYYLGAGVEASTTTLGLYQLNTSALNNRLDTPLTATPFTWAVSDEFRIAGWYEGA